MIAQHSTMEKLSQYGLQMPVVYGFMAKQLLRWVYLIHFTSEYIPAYLNLLIS